jgi:hypothetical protein
MHAALHVIIKCIYIARDWKYPRDVQIPADPTRLIGFSLLELIRLISADFSDA